MLSIRRALILSTYLFAFLAMLMIFQHEALLSRPELTPYSKSLLRGSNYLRTRISELREKAKDLLFVHKDDDDDSVEATEADATDAKDDEKYGEDDDDVIALDKTTSIGSTEEVIEEAEERGVEPEASPVKATAQEPPRGATGGTAPKQSPAEGDDDKDDVEMMGDIFNAVEAGGATTAPAPAATVAKTTETTVSALTLPKEAEEYIKSIEQEVHSNATTATEVDDDGIDDIFLDDKKPSAGAADERGVLGKLQCNGKSVASEVIYWRQVPGDAEYESPVTPHHDEHHDKYLTFAYDGGGWNNVRMGVECLIVIAHAMGRTLVIPPQEHLYLLDREHKDQHETETHNEMGFVSLSSSSPHHPPHSSCRRTSSTSACSDPTADSTPCPCKSSSRSARTH